MTLLWGRLGQASQQWAIHREILTASLLGMEAPLDCRNEWQRLGAMDHISNLDLDADGDLTLVVGLLRKHQSGGTKRSLSLSSPAPSTAGSTGTFSSISTKQSDTRPSGIDCRHVSGQVGLSRSCPSRWASEGHTKSDHGELP